MCKTKYEGGQRCPGHARARVEAAVRALDELEDALDDANLTPADNSPTLANARARVREAMVEFASTNEGAAELRQVLADNKANPDFWGAEAAIREAEQVIDEGAELAQTNREVENAYRATQGKPRLATPVPVTFAQESAQAAARERGAAYEAARKADPFGLRAEQAAAEAAAASAPARWSFEQSPNDAQKMVTPTTYPAPKEPSKAGFWGRRKVRKAAQV